MSFIRLFRSDPMNLIGPDLEKSPVKSIHLSGNKLTFKCPEKTANVTPFLGSDEYNIDTDPQIETHNDLESVVRIFSSGWQFIDRAFSGIPYGGLLLDMIIIKQNKNTNSKTSLLIRENHEIWTLTSNAKNYGRRNSEMHKHLDKVLPENDYWRYPETTDDLTWKTINGRNWSKYEVYQPESEPYIEYETAITNQHILKIFWSPSAYHGIDFFGSNHNLRTMTTNLMNDIMTTMKIELSQKTRKQYEEAGVPVP